MDENLIPQNSGKAWRAVPFWRGVFFFSLGLLGLWILVFGCTVQPFEQTLTTGILSTSVDSLKDVQIVIDYPKRIGRLPTPNSYHQHLTVHARQTRFDVDQIHLRLQPYPSVVHLLSKDELEIGYNVPLTLTKDVTATLAVDLESLSTPDPLEMSLPQKLLLLLAPRDVSFEIDILPPTRSLTESVSLSSGKLSLEAESLVQRALRSLISAIPWQTFLATALVALFSNLYDRYRKISNLFPKFRQASRLPEQRRVMDEYNDLVLKWGGVRFPVNEELERVYRRAQADDEFEHATEAWSRAQFSLAEKHIDGALKQDGTHQLALGLRWLMEKEPLKMPRAEKGDYDAAPVRGLLTLLKNNQAPENLRIHALRKLGLINTAELKEKVLGYDVQTAIRDAMIIDPSLAVQTEAALCITQRSIQGPNPVHPTDPELLTTWFRCHDVPLQEPDNPPFVITHVEQEPDVKRVKKYYYGKWYEQLMGPGPAALFAPRGGGKTFTRMMLQDQLPSDALVIPHLNFADGSTLETEITLDDHVQRMIDQACLRFPSARSICSEPGKKPARRMRDLMHLLESEGCHTTYILVDNLDHFSSAQALKTLMPLVNSEEMLDKPNLHFKFFVGTELKQALLELPPFASGKIHLVEIIWTEKRLWDLVDQAMEQSIAGTSSERILWRFADPKGELRGYESYIQHQLVDLAKGSPERLVTLVNLFLGHRARLWNLNQRNEQDIGLTLSDWADLLWQAQCFAA